MTERTERRRFHRISLVDSVDAVAGRIRPGRVVRVLELSPGGGLIETSARLLPGTHVDLHLESGEIRTGIRARVVRCFVGSVSPVSIVFRGALQFDVPLPVARVGDGSSCDQSEPSTTPHALGLRAAVGQ